MVNHAEIARVNKVETHPDSDLSHLSIVHILDKIAISGKKEDGSHSYNEDALVLFLPVNAIIPLGYLQFQGYYWDAGKNRGMLGGNQRNRVKAVTRGSKTSQGILIPLGYEDEDQTYFLEKEKKYDPNNFHTVKEGDYVEDWLGITWFEPK